MFFSWVRIWYLGECPPTMIATFSVSFFGPPVFAPFILRLFYLVCIQLASLHIPGE